MRDTITGFRRVLVAIAIVGVASATAGVGTMALFSDTETTGGTISAGTLDLVLGSSGSTTINVSDAEPGRSGSTTLEIRNDGNINGTLTSFNVSNVNDQEGVNPEPETDTDSPGDLSDALTLTLYVDDDGDLSTTDDQIQIASGNLSTLTGSHSLTKDLNRNTNSYAVVEWSIPSTAGNDIQGDSVRFDITIHLEQA